MAVEWNDAFLNYQYIKSKTCKLIVMNFPCHVLNWWLDVLVGTKKENTNSCFVENNNMTTFEEPCFKFWRQILNEFFLTLATKNEQLHICQFQLRPWWPIRERKLSRETHNPQACTWTERSRQGILGLIVPHRHDRLQRSLKTIAPTQGSIILTFAKLYSSCLCHKAYS